MYIVVLKENHVVIDNSETYTILKNGYPALDNGTRAYYPNDLDGVFEVDSLPSDYEMGKYCYTADKGFYANPNYVEPQAPVEDRVTALETENAELKAELAQTQEVLDYLLMNEE